MIFHLCLPKAKKKKKKKKKKKNNKKREGGKKRVKSKKKKKKKGPTLILTIFVESAYGAWSGAVAWRSLRAPERWSLSEGFGLVHTPEQGHWNWIEDGGRLRLRITFHHGRAGLWQFQDVMAHSSARIALIRICRALAAVPGTKVVRPKDCH